MQPLDGFVAHPAPGTQTDLFGSPLASAEMEVDKLSSVQQALLRDCVGRGRVVTSTLGGHGALEALNDLELRGLVRRSPTRGRVITGRGLVLREELLRLQGQDTIDAWLG